MKPSALWLAFILLCKIALPAFAADPAPSPSLASLLALHSKDPDQDVKATPISPEWVGTVKRVYLRGGGGVYGKDEPAHIRFTHAWIRRKQLAIARMRGDVYVGSEAPNYRAELPSLEVITQCKTVEELQKLFGPQQGFTDGWEDGSRMYWTAGWTFFGVTKPDRLRYLSVFAHISKAQGAASTDIDIFLVREGIFQPADLNSAEERRQFKTGAQLFEEEQVAVKAKRAEYPQPLRDFMAARETPGDHDLTKYTAYLSTVRAKPDAKLFQQLLAHAHEDTVRYNMFLEDILIDSYLKPDEWKPGKRREALGFLVDSLDQTQDPLAFSGVIEVFLRALGGGEVEYQDLKTKSGGKIEVTVKNDGYQTVHGSSGRAPALGETQRQLRAMLEEKIPKDK